MQRGFKGTIISLGNTCVELNWQNTVQKLWQ